MRTAIVVIFSNKADDHLARLVKAVDNVQRNNKNLGTVVVGIDDVEAADMEKLQERHRLSAPLTVASRIPKRYALNPKAAVTVVIYKPRTKSRDARSFGFTDTQSAAAAGKRIAAAIATALK